MAILKLNNNSLTSVTELPSGVGSDPNTKVSLARLGLRVFANQNLATSNSQNLSYDIFQDSTGIQNLINCVRSSSEFVSSNIPAQFNTNDSTLSTNILNLYKMDNALTDSIGNQNLLNSPDGSGSNVIFSSSLKKLGTHSAYFDGSQYSELAFDNGSGSSAVPYFHTNNSNGSYPPPALSIAYWAYWTADNNNWNMVLDGYHTATSTKRNYIFTIGHDGSSANAHDKPAIWDGSDENWGIAQDGGSETPASAISHNTWVHIVQTLTTSKKQIFVNGSLSGSAQTGTFGFNSNGGGAHARIGGRSSDPSYQFKGNLDQFEDLYIHFRGTNESRGGSLVFKRIEQEDGSVRYEITDLWKSALGIQ